MFFDSWQGLLRVLVVGVLAYVALVLLLRISGKRTLSKMNAFDMVVTVALGSTLASVLLTKSVSLAEGVLGFAVLIALQYALTWTSVRSGWVRRLVKSEPTLLVHKGQLLEGALRRQRVVPAEIREAVRSQGVARLEDVEAVVLETDGTFSVLKSGDRPSTLLGDVTNTPKGKT